MRKTQQLKPMRFSKSSAKRAVQATCLPQETRETTNKQPNVTLTGTRKKNQK